MSKKKPNSTIGTRKTTIGVLNEFNWKVLNHKEFQYICPYEMTIKSLNKLGISKHNIPQSNFAFIMENMLFIKNHNMNFKLHYSIYIPNEYIPKVKKPIHKDLSNTIIKEILKTDINDTKPKYTKKLIPITKPKVEISSIDPNTQEFLDGYQWRKLRQIAIEFYGKQCECCGDIPSKGAILNVDHIKPRKTHPKLALDIDNLQILCSVCNHGKGNWSTTKWRLIPEVNNRN